MSLCMFWIFDYYDFGDYEYLREVIVRDGVKIHNTRHFIIRVSAIDSHTLGRSTTIDLRMNIGNKTNITMGEGYSIRLKKSKL